MSAPSAASPPTAVSDSGTSPFGRLFLARHGETEWSRAGRHTGRTDIALTEAGERDARRLAERLEPRGFVRAFTSPLARASRTCELAGFGSIALRDADLLEWDYGEYEGLRSEEIRRLRPGWNVFRDGCPGGEGPADVARRADRVLARCRALRGDVIVFSSGHFLRVLGARWLAQDAVFGACLYLATASLSILGYEHDLEEPVIRLWNETAHLAPR